MKIREIVTAVGLALSASAFAQTLQTHRAIGTAGYEVAYEIQKTEDGGYVTVGRIGVSPTVLSDIHVVKYDRFGNTTWSRRYGSLNQAPDVGHSIQQTPDGGYVVGFESTTVSNRQGLGLMRLTAAGGVVWTRMYTGTPFIDSPAGVQVLLLEDGTLAAIGRLQSAAGVLNPMLIRAQPTGAPISQTRYVIPNVPEFSFTDIIQDGPAFAIAGWHLANANSVRQPMLVNTDLAGNIAWANEYTLPGVALATADAITRTRDGYAFAGRNDTVAGGLLGLAAEVNLAGIFQWGRAIREFRVGISAADTNESSVFFYGEREGFGESMMIEFGPAGGLRNSMWYTPFNSNTNGHDIIALPCNRGLAMTGETAFQSTGQQDIHFLRSGLNGETGCFEGPAFAAVAPIPLLRGPLGMARVPETLTSPVEMFVQDVPLNNIRFCFSEGCPADINHDNAVDGDDVIAFFSLWDLGLPCADVTGDNAVDGDDVIFVFFRWDAGC
jgi:hypothetical protein